MDMLAGGGVVRSGRPRADMMTIYAGNRISLTYAKKAKFLVVTSSFQLATRHGSNFMMT